MSARFVILDHDIGNRGEDYEDHCHKFRVAFWLPCPPSLKATAAARRPIKVYIPSRSSSHSRGIYSSNVEGRPCGGCPNGVEPVTHVAGATESEVAAIRAGELLEFVVDEAGGQVPSHFDDESTIAHLTTVYDEIGSSLAELGARAQTQQKRLIGKAVLIEGT